MPNDASFLAPNRISFLAVVVLPSRRPVGYLSTPLHRPRAHYLQRTSALWHSTVNLAQDEPLRPVQFPSIWLGGQSMHLISYVISSTAYPRTRARLLLSELDPRMPSFPPRNPLEMKPGVFLTRRLGETCLFPLTLLIYRSRPILPTPQYLLAPPPACSRNPTDPSFPARVRLEKSESVDIGQEQSPCYNRLFVGKSSKAHHFSQGQTSKMRSARTADTFAWTMPLLVVLWVHRSGESWSLRAGRSAKFSGCHVPFVDCHTSAFDVDDCSQRDPLIFFATMVDPDLTWPVGTHT